MGQQAMAWRLAPAISANLTYARDLEKQEQ
jgi:hypothetical protein